MLRFVTDNIGWLQDTLEGGWIETCVCERESGHMSHNPVTAVHSLATRLQPVSTNSSIFHGGKHPATIQLMNDFVSFTPSFPTHGPQLFPHGPLSVHACSLPSSDTILSLSLLSLTKRMPTASGTCLGRKASEQTTRPTAAWRWFYLIHPAKATTTVSRILLKMNHHHNALLGGKKIEAS